MGTEYRLSFKYPDPDTVKQELSRLKGARIRKIADHSLEFQNGTSGKGMPDATVSVQDYGLYFCDHGGLGGDFLGRVIARLVRKFGNVEISEVEG